MQRVIVLLLLGLVLPLVAQATDRYASPGGGGSSCSSGSPCSLSTGLSQTSVGDTLYLKTGTYNETIGGSQPVSGGTGWGSGQFKTIASAPGETATIQPFSGNMITLGDGAGYIVFDRLIFDGVNIDQGFGLGGGWHHLRVQNSVIKNGKANNVQIGGGAGGSHEFLNNIVHHGGYNFDCTGQPGCGGSGGYGYYIEQDNVLVEGGEIYDHSGYGIQIYSGGRSPNNNIVRGVTIRNNATAVPSQSGILVGTGSGNLVYNNVIRHNSHGVQVAFNASNSGIYHNTVYGNPNTGISIGDFGASSTIVQNNIIYANGGQVSNNGSNTSFGTNLCGSNQAGPCDPSLTSDPGFVSAPGGDFHIALAGSRAVNCCPRLAGVTTDAEGFNRTNPTTAGPYEFGAACIPGNCPTGCCGNSCCPPNPDPGTLLFEILADEGTGTTAADTAPGNAHPCTLTSAGWQSPGIIGASAFSFNGSRSCEISNVAQPTNFALSLWIKGTVFPAATGCMFAIGDSVEVCINSTGRPTFTVFTDTYYVLTGPNVVQDGTPHHLVVSYHPSDAMRMWDNGAQVPSVAATGNITYPFGTLTQIGRYFTDNQYAYTGVADQFRAYAAPLAQADVDSLRNEMVPTSGTAVHDMAWYDADAAEGVNGVVNADLTSLLTTPKGIRFGLRNATGADITEYFKPYCRVNTGAGYGGWVEVDNSFGSDGIRFHTDMVKNLGDATTNLLPLDGAMAGAGKFIVDTVDLTSPYDAVQKITIANGAQVDMEVRVDFGSPLGNGHLVQCKPRRESGADLTEYGGPGDQAIRTLTVQTLAPVSGIRIGGAVTGGTER